MGGARSYLKKKIPAEGRDRKKNFQLSQLEEEKIQPSQLAENEFKLDLSPTKVSIRTIIKNENKNLAKPSLRKKIQPSYF